MTTEALAVREGQLVEATPLPVFGGAAMIQALEAYKNLQAALDRAMPDQIMQLEGRPFRKKGYWRAVAVAFHLTVEPVSETREVTTQFDDGRDNFGWVVSYRATAPNGRSVVGDGSCYAVEKAKRFRCPHPESEGSRRTAHFPPEQCPDFDPGYSWRALPAQATEHNIRSHANTRAFNRAVSNLVGFGEVSAEEMAQEAHDEREAPTASTTVAQTPVGDREPGTVGVVTTDQRHSKPGASKEWTLYIVTFDAAVKVNGSTTKEGTTFDKKIWDEAVEARGQGWVCQPEITGEKAGDKMRFTIVKLNVRRPAAVSTESGLPLQGPIEPDTEPVGGAEKVLTVVKRGQHWVIQTDRRMYTTDQQGMADYADEVRKVKGAVVAQFEPRPDTKGVVYNILLSLSEPDATAAP